MTAPSAGRPAIERDEGGAQRFARRGLLRGLAAGGAAAALGAHAASAATADTPAEEASAESDRRRLGFRTTDHVRWFYRRARW